MKILFQCYTKDKPNNVDKKILYNFKIVPPATYSVIFDSTEDTELFNL